ncbi:MAG TPA: chorismate mutase [Methylomirabilota bacterium]|nr:chorismate mutase [Methylomirabilota bacterium]
MDKKLETLRKEIDHIDKELLELLAKRMAVVAKVGALKKEKHASIIDEKRYEELLQSKAMFAEKIGLSKEFIRQIYALIHDYAVELQKKI